MRMLAGVQTHLRQRPPHVRQRVHTALQTMRHSRFESCIQRSLRGQVAVGSSTDCDCIGTDTGTRNCPGTDTQYTVGSSAPVVLLLPSPLCRLNYREIITLKKIINAYDFTKFLVFNKHSLILK